MFAASKSARSGATNDPNFSYVSLLLNGDGTNGKQNNTFLDSSTNNFTITRNGTPTQGSFSPYGSLWGVYFPNPQKTGFNQTYTDFLTVNSANVNLTSSSYTLEAWVLPTALPTNVNPTEEMPIFGWWAASGNRWGFDLRASGTGLIGRVFTDSPVTVLEGTTAYPLNQWMHVALTYDGTTTRIFINGTLHASTAFSFARNLTALWIGKYPYNSGSITDLGGFQGWISNVRILKGTALYTSSFNPPTAPLTVITNTVLLTCQSNRFIDNSSGALTVTPNGNVSIQRFSPFEPTTSYTPAVNGGSGYFNGSTDYITAPASANLALGAGDFTVEFWAYLTANPSGAMIASCRLANGGASGTWGIYSNQSGKWNFAEILQTPTTNVSSNTTPVLNTWTHVAIVRSGTTLSIYLNGVLDVTGTSSTNFNNSSYPFRSMWDSGTIYTSGYLTDFRIVKGTAVYNANFTPPSVPLTAVTNTQLLTSFTNAGISDAAAANDLITAGNAQVSTTAVKYGTGSMKFSGTGDYLKYSVSGLNKFGSGDFTIEGWIYRNDTTNGGFYSDRVASPDQSGLVVSIRSNKIGLLVSVDGTTWGINTVSTPIGNSVPTLAWSHIAVTRSGTTFRTFIDGVLSYSSTLSGSINQTQNNVFIGADMPDTLYLNGYIDDLRITKGLARYTANFTPPTAALPTF